MKRVLEYLRNLAANNNKVWFDAHKDEYLLAKKVFEDFTEQLIAKVEAFDPTVKGLTVKDCTYRIYRDLRFSHDKTPYKQHIGTYVCPHGKKSGYAGYYVHIEPNAKYFICTGLWCPEPRFVKSVREEIMLDGKNFDKAIRKAKGFSLSWEDSLKKIPAGFNADDEFADYYRLKSFLIEKEIDENYILDKNFVDNVVADLRQTYDFCSLLNKSVEYAIEMY